MEDQAIAQDTQVEQAVAAPELQEAANTNASLLDGVGPSPKVEDQSTPEETRAEVDSFLKDLPEELRGKKSLQTIKSVEDLAKSYVELQSKFGKRLEDLTADELKELNPKFGIPEDPTKYNFDNLELPDEVSVDADQLEEFREVFHSLGLPEKQARELVQQYVAKDAERQRVMHEQYYQRREQEVNSLKQEFGLAFDERIALANTALREFGGDEVVKVLQEYGLDTNPSLTKMFTKLGEFVSEDTLKGSGASSTGAMTPDEAKAAIQQKLNDKEFARRYYRGTPEERKQAGIELSNMGKFIK